MEKSSEKMIRETSPLKNRFRDMLSEVQIKLPSIIETKQKPRNLVLQIESYFDRSISNVIEGGGNPSNSIKKREYNQNIRENQINFLLNVPLTTKNSSMKRENAVMERLQYLIQEKNLFNQYSYKNIKTYQRQLLKNAFKSIKNHYQPQNYTFENIQSMQNQQKIGILSKIIEKLMRIRIKNSFQILLQLYRDSLLFGLSNTVADLKDNSLLKLQSQCGLLGLQTGKLVIKESKTAKQFPEINMSRKGSQSYGSESLSALILNHNKLNITPETNQPYPNIPKSNRNLSNRLIASNKEIAELSLQTKKKIQSSKKLIEKDLPLESRKNLNDANQKQVPNQIMTNIQNEKTGNRPITFTYILRNLDFNGSLPNAGSIENIHSKKMTVEDKYKQKTINGIYMKESLYPIRNVFIQENKTQPQKRSVSMQINHLPKLFISPQKPLTSNNQTNLIRIYYNSQYYNQQNCNRQNLIRVFDQFKDGGQPKPRAKSATPKITFNFCQSNQSPILQVPINGVGIVQNKKTNCQQYDCIVQKSLLQDRYKPLVQENRREKVIKTNRFQVFSPSRRRDSKNIEKKIKTQQRQFIKEKLLPPVCNQYYIKQQSQYQNRIKVPFLSNSNTSTEPTFSLDNQQKKGSLKQLKNNFVKQLYFAEIQQQQVRCQPAFCHKTSQQKGPKQNCQKEQILVTYNCKNKA